MCVQHSMKLRPKGVTWQPALPLKTNGVCGILGPAVRSGGTTAEGLGDVMRVGLGGAATVCTDGAPIKRGVGTYAVCAGGGPARRWPGSMDAACTGDGPARMGLGGVDPACASCGSARRGLGGMVTLGVYSL